MTVTVLLVEDNKYERELCRIRLQRSDMDISLAEASSGPQCLDLLQQEAFDVVLLDLNMPEMNGDETLAELRQTHPDKPAVIILSGSEDPSVELPLAQGRLNKPLDLEQLAALLTELDLAV